mgnify:FL=1
MIKGLSAKRRLPSTDEVMCDNCPFARTGAGAHLRRSLMPGRMEEIKRSVLNGAPFYCHKTTDDEGWDDDSEFYSATGKERVCGGSVRWLRRSA